MEFGFENDERIPVEAFAFPPEDRDPDELEAQLRSQRAQVEAMIAYLLESRRPATAGRRTLALGFVLGAMPDIRSQKQLAAMLGVSEPAVSKLIGQARVYLRKQSRGARIG